MNKGFNLVEVLIATTVLAVVITMAFPRIEQFIYMGKKQEEERLMKELRATMQRYAQDKRYLPDTGDDWWEEFAPYTDLSQEEIKIDPWGNERIYVSISPQRSINFKGGSYDVYRAIIYSYGENGCMGTIASCDMTEPAHVFTVSDFDQWSDFQDFQTVEGDFSVRYTDAADKIDMYNTSQKRIRAISEALSRYAEQVYQAEFAAGREVLRSSIPFPPNSIGGWPPPAGLYPQTVLDDVNGVIDDGNGLPRVFAGGSFTRRRASMQSLMRFLGLPEEYCCDALNVGAAGQEIPFYYYSNPRRRTGSGGADCATRPGVADVKLPPRISRLGRFVGSCG